MPHHDPIPSPRHSALRRFRKIMRYMAFAAILSAALAVALVAWGSEGLHIHMLIATALGVGLSVLLAGALMSLVFMSSSSGHDATAARHQERDQERDQE